MVGCSSEPEFTKLPLDEIVKQKGRTQDYTIVLDDMDLEENLFSSDHYKHRYKVITMEKAAGDTIATPKEHLTDWYDVPRAYFDNHVNDMGMELATMTDGKLSKQVGPAGYSQFVGNPQYGQWKTGSNGSSFWEFYGKYAMMRSLFAWTFYQPVYRSYYNDYSRYRSTGRPYYGTTSTSAPRKYGTFSPAAKEGPKNERSTSSSTARRGSRTFTSKMANNNSYRRSVTSSAGRSAYGPAGSRSSSSRSRTSSSSGRYGSSSRSRSGGSYGGK
ncbi:hypothetical protein GCM10023331_03280 [Algivirga pacifica]|uniref:Lipoprotein n=2 Tax=Algivirga pacifica TaxID=1162670 RepID=A0ABP9D4R9_9BACT